MGLNYRIKCHLHLIEGFNTYGVTRIHKGAWEKVATEVRGKARRKPMEGNILRKLVSKCCSKC
jgi:hypothetical protein